VSEEGVYTFEYRILTLSSSCVVSEGGTYCGPRLIGGTVMLTSVCKVAEHELSFEQ